MSFLGTNIRYPAIGPGELGINTFIKSSPVFVFISWGVSLVIKPIDQMPLRGYSIKIVKLPRDQWGQSWDIHKYALYEYLGFFTENKTPGQGLGALFEY